MTTDERPTVARMVFTCFGCLLALAALCAAFGGP